MPLPTSLIYLTAETRRQATSLSERQPELIRQFCRPFLKKEAEVAISRVAYSLCDILQRYGVLPASGSDDEHIVLCSFPERHVEAPGTCGMDMMGLAFIQKKEDRFIIHIGKIRIYLWRCHNGTGVKWICQSNILRDHFVPGQKAA